MAHQVGGNGEIVPGGEQRRGEAAPEHVRRHLPEPGSSPEHLHPLPDGPGAHSACDHPPPLVHGPEERPVLRPPDRDPGGHGGGASVRPEVGDPLPAALAVNSERVAVQVGQPGGGQLRPPEPRPVREREQRGVPRAGGVVPIAAGAKYCLHDAPEPDEAERPESTDRVEWAETRNLASRPERAAGQMAATANAAPELKRLAGVSAAGRKLEKPVVHYTLSWAKDERPDRAEMNRAAEETLEALGLERHQALVVAHNDKAHPHVHVIANRVDPETGKAASLRGDRHKLSRWAERWERERGQVKCPERVKNNAERAKGTPTKDRKSLHTARHRRERMHPPRVQRRVAPRVRLKTPANRQKWEEREGAAWTQQQADRPREWNEIANIYRHQWRQHFVGERSDRAEVKTLACGGVTDRLRLARIAEGGDWARLLQVTDEKRGGGFGRKMRGAWKEVRSMGVRSAIGAARTDPAEAEREALAKLELEHRLERARLGRDQSWGAGGVERDLAEQYQERMGEADRGAGRDAAMERRQNLAAARTQMPQQMPDQGPSRDRGGGFER